MPVSAWLVSPDCRNASGPLRGRLYCVDDSSLIAMRPAALPNRPAASHRAAVCAPLGKDMLFPWVRPMAALLRLRRSALSAKSRCPAAESSAESKSDAQHGGTRMAGFGQVSERQLAAACGRSRPSQADPFLPSASGGYQAADVEASANCACTIGAKKEALPRLLRQRLRNLK
jgi:hypothetical protein